MGTEGGSFAPFPEAAPAPRTPLLPPALPPREVGPDRGDDAPAFERPAITPPSPPEDPASGPAIGRAGSLLAEDGPTPPGSRGKAAIVTPPDPKAPAKDDRKTGASSGSSPSSGKSKGTGQRRARSAAPLPRPDLTVMIVNETGSPAAADNYRAVLASVGYQVVGIAERPSSSPGSRQTVISCVPGKEGQARALARRLPGNKAVSVSREPLPAQAIVIIR